MSLQGLMAKAKSYRLTARSWKLFYRHFRWFSRFKQTGSERGMKEKE